MKTIIRFSVHFTDTKLPSVELFFEVPEIVPLARDSLVSVGANHKAVVEHTIFDPAAGEMLVHCWGQFWSDYAAAKSFIEEARKLGWSIKQ